MTTWNEEHFQAMAAYKAEHGKEWKDRLLRAWQFDYKEQWGLLRQVRNSPQYANGKGMMGIFKSFEAEEKRRAKA